MAPEGPRAESGALRFARYAYPPNELGYCGPDASRQLIEQVTAGADDGDLRRLLAGFEGAWPYLQLIAAANAIADPLDARVVEAYWVGNRLLGRVGTRLMGDSVELRFRARVGRYWDRLADTVPSGALPHHSFHVFGVYPWLGLLREGWTVEPLRVLDRCRIRWGRVLSVEAGKAKVLTRPLVWDGRALSLGEPHEEQAVVSTGSLGLAGPVRAGDWCSLHWDWVCERLDRQRLSALRQVTVGQLAVVNGVAVPPAAVVLA